MSSSTISQNELGRMLSIKSLVPTSNVTSSNHLVKIGAGTCGTILTRLASNTALKLAKHKTTALTGDLSNDFKWHQRSYDAIAESLPIVTDLPRVPCPRQWISATHKPWWDAHRDIKDAATDTAPCDIISSERIDPLPQSVRNLLIDMCCPEDLRANARQEPANKDCLVRVYLGANKAPAPDGPGKRFFSLRNYKLYFNQMVEVSMEVMPYARSMASALAVMHWKVGIDAKDVEYVIGLSPRPSCSQPRQPEDQRETAFWLLDFNLCSAITMDDAGVEMAAKAWSINDPYYPRPLQDSVIEKDLWNEFIRRYVEVSDQVLQSRPELLELPRRFIQKIIGMQREKLEQRAKADT